MAFTKSILLKSMDQESIKLSREEKLKLISAHKNGCQEAASILCKGYLKLMLKLANQLKRTHIYQRNSLICIDDMIANAYIGLVDGLNKIDVKKCKNPDSYLMLWCKEFMYREVREMFSAVKTPVAKQNSIRQIDKLCNEHGGNIDEAFDEWVSKNPRSKKSAKRLKQFYTSNKISVSSISQFRDADDGFEFDIEDEHKPTSDLSDDIAFHLNKLEPIEREVVQRYFGIKCQSETHQTISKRLKIKPIKSNQILHKVLSKLKTNMSN